MKQRVYLDWNATAPLRPEARDAMVAAMDLVGNPSSVHAEGRAAKALVERSRDEIAEAFGANAADVVFTSGATEAAALMGRAFSEGIAATDIEHDSVLAISDVRRYGEVLETGAVKLPLPQIGRGIPSRHVFAVQAANSETGVVQDWAVLSEEIEKSGGTCVCDAVQAFGKMPFAFDWTGFTAAMISGHKIGGPKGVGALVVRKGTDISPLIAGGGQEMGRRSGTENVIGIAGFAAAAKAAQHDLAAGLWEQIAERRNAMEAAILSAVPEAHVAGVGSVRLPNTSCIIVPGWKGETQVMQMDLAGFAISAGSACSSGKVRASRVLKAMGYDDVAAASAIRISIGPKTTETELTNFADAWAAAHSRHRARAA